jgi:MoaA/NifB/PqqE/SkfB family radical SAM enzyme
MGLDELRITVMAGTRDLYARTHPGSPENTFDRLRENLLYLTEKKRSLRKRRPRLKLFCVVISENVGGLADFGHFGESVGADEVHYRPFDDVGDPGLSKLILTPDQSAEAQRQILDVKPFLESKGILHNINEFFVAFHHRLDTSELYRVIPCYYPWLVIRVEPDGHLYPCCRSYLPQGNVYQQSFPGIWNSESYLRIRKEAGTLPQRKSLVTGSSCSSCVNFMANLRVYRTLHPFQDVSSFRDRVYPDG